MSFEECIECNGKLLKKRTIKCTNCKEIICHDCVNDMLHKCYDSEKEKKYIKQLIFPDVVEKKKPEKVMKTFKCDICDVYITKSSAYNHLSTMKHKYNEALRKLESIKNM